MHGGVERLKDMKPFCMLLWNSLFNCMKLFRIQFIMHPYFLKRVRLQGEAPG